MDTNLGRAAQLSNILALLPGAYCAYGTYILLHSESQLPLPHAGPQVPLVRDMSVTGVWVSLGLFLSCIAVGAVLNFIVLPRRNSSQKKLIIYSALYGIGAFNDVTVIGKLKAAVKDALVVPVDNNLVDGKDPARNQGKRLRVEYSYGHSERRVVEKPESQPGHPSVLVLPEEYEFRDPQRTHWENLYFKENSERTTVQKECARVTNKAIELEHQLADAQTQLKNMPPVSPLQKDALKLSIELLDFVKQIGPVPAPKYTAEDIANMTASQMKPLMQDEDFLEALQYYQPNEVAFTRTQSEKQLTAYGKRIYPWYQKLEATYALEGFNDKVEKLRNRFLLEGITDDVLLMPIEGKYGVERVRNIASKLWELAYKTGEKGIL
jgi:hypothetical protein